MKDEWDWEMNEWFSTFYVFLFSLLGCFILRYMNIMTKITKNKVLWIFVQWFVCFVNFVLTFNRNIDAIKKKTII